MTALPLRPISTLALAAGLAGLTALGGCVLGGTRCESDGDCDGDFCARNGECTSSLVFVRAVWTVNGQPPTEASCAPHPWLSITFEDRDYDEELTYEPIRCTLGQITFDRMPTRYDEVELRARDAEGELVTSHRSAIEPPAVMIDWDLGALAAPTN